MGQTLNHGVYLPAEGERNCYSGLASNWNLLDTAIGDTAGKASATHTHGNITNDGKVGTTANLPLITGTGGVVQAGSFGNQANTFCEGNDSRLSDARTPVAHTHTKSDVTDLLNSNFIPSANNTYDLGSSSYQWNNLYAKNYYYNGVAWGLDKSNVWTGTNTFQQNVTYERANFFHKAVNPNYYLKDSELQVGVTPNSPHIAYPGNWQDKNDQQLGYVRFVQYENSIQTFECDIRNKASNGAWSPNGTLQTVGFQIVNNPAVSKGDFRLYANLVPNSDNNYNLGTATKRWKSLNGINPGALSLPDYSSPDPINFSQWSVPGNNAYTPTEDGWLCIITKDTATSSIFVYSSSLGSDSRYCGSVYGNGSQGPGRLAIMFPVRANVTYTVILQGDSVSDIYAVRFYSCQGNV